jgi:hypothetical protein
MALSDRESREAAAYEAAVEEANKAAIKAQEEEA